MSVLHHFIETENNLVGLLQILKRGANTNDRDRTGCTPLHYAVLKSERIPEETDYLLLVVRELINFGARVNLGNNRGKTPLHYAVSCRNLKMIKMLLQLNADVNAKDDEGYTILHYAASKRRFNRYNYYDTDANVVRLLLKYDVKLDEQGRRKETALIHATQINDIEVLQVLLNKNVSAKLQDIHGNSALHYILAQSQVNEKVVLELMRHGGSFNVFNNSEVSPISLYFRRLLAAPRAELEKAKYVFKLYEFYSNGFNENQRNRILHISKTRNYPLHRFVKVCHREIDQMHRDRLAPDYTIRDIAVRGAYCRFLTNIDRFPLEVCEKVFDKLVRGQYPIYCDLISAGICDPYLRIKFATVCSLVKTKNGYMDYGALILVSSYLSTIDMLNMIKACYWGFRRHWYLPRFIYNTRCSVS